MRIIDLDSFLRNANGLRFMNQIVEVGNPPTRRYGELNVNFHKRTRVDWASLTLVIRRTP